MGKQCSESLWDLSKVTYLEWQSVDLNKGFLIPCSGLTLHPLFCFAEFPYQGRTVGLPATAQGKHSVHFMGLKSPQVQLPLSGPGLA